jgi:predicted Zn-dependent protease
MATKTPRAPLAVLATIVCLSANGLFAQTVIKLPSNKYTPQQDVELGREAAAEVRQQYPIIEDETIARYLTSLGDRLVAAAPPEFKQPIYEYSFTPVNLKEIDAFALPGGPMFVQRGMFDAAAAEGEVVGVMARRRSWPTACCSTTSPWLPKKTRRHFRKHSAASVSRSG